MKDIKKLMITLVALLAVTTGAWAQGPWTSGDCTVTFSDGVMTVSGTGAMADYEEYNYTPWSSYDVKTIVIESGVTSIGVNALSSCSKLESVSIPASVTSIGNYAFEACGSYATALTVSFAEGSKLLTIGEEAFRSANLKSIDIPNSVTSIGRSAFSGCSNLESVSIPASVTSIGVEAFYNCGMLAKVSIYAPSLTTYGAYAFHENAAGRKIYVLSDAVDTYKAGWSAYAADIVGDLQPLASGPEVAWNKAEKTGTFTMPGGNVTLEPEYYPQATLAFKGLTAAEDAAAKTDAPLAVLADGAVTGGTLMYYVATDKNFSQADAIALAETEWSADIPTAETIDAAGTCYVWYYIKGDAEHSDTDPVPLAVTLLPEPTYAVTFAEGTDPNEWTASPNTGVKKGQQVTVNYTGSKKVIGVKAEKKKRPEFVPSATIQDLSSFVEVKNNKDGTITLHMPTLNPSTYNVTNSSLSNGEHTLHFGYEMGSGTNMSSIGVNIIAKSWSDHTPFSELDKTIDITSGMPRVAIMITGHVKTSTCPAPGKEHYWGLYRYTNPVKVTYNLGGGSVSGSTADKVEYLFSGDALATTFAAPTREGYTFDGWYTSAEGGTKLTASNATSATTIYAHWNAIAE